MAVKDNLKKIFKINKNINSQISYKNETSKYSLTADCTMELSFKTEQKKKEINDYLKELVKKYIETPEKLIQYISLKGATVYRIKNASKILPLIGEEEGFITPQKGIKAIILNAIISILTENKLKIKSSTDEILIFNTEGTEIYTVARALHKYYGFQNKLPGFDFYSQKIFKKIYGRRKSKCAAAQMENVSLKDVFACRDALARDLESVNFALHLAVEYEKSKKALNKIIKEKNAKI